MERPTRRRVRRHALQLRNAGESQPQPQSQLEATLPVPHSVFPWAPLRTVPARKVAGTAVARLQRLRVTSASVLLPGLISRARIR